MKKEQIKYISILEASRNCKYSQEYLSLRARQGKLKSKKIGRNWYTTSEWLSEYLNQNGKLPARKEFRGYNSSGFSKFKIDFIFAKFTDTAAKIILAPFYFLSVFSKIFFKEIFYSFKKIFKAVFNSLAEILLNGSRAFIDLILFSAGELKKAARFFYKPWFVFKDFKPYLNTLNREKLDGWNRAVFGEEKNFFVWQKLKASAVLILLLFFLYGINNIQKVKAFFIAGKSIVYGAALNLPAGFNEALLEPVIRSKEQLKALSPPLKGYKRGFSGIKNNFSELYNYDYGEKFFSAAEESFDKGNAYSASVFGFLRKKIAETKDGVKEFSSGLKDGANYVFVKIGDLRDKILGIDKLKKDFKEGEDFSKKNEENTEKSINIKTENTVPDIAFDTERENLTKKNQLVKEGVKIFIKEENSSSFQNIYNEIKKLKSKDIKIESPNFKTILAKISGLENKKTLTKEELDSELSKINNKFLSELSELKNQIINKTAANFDAIALSNRINSLYQPVINSPTISSPVISGASVSGNANLEILTTSGLATLNSLSVSNSAILNSTLSVIATSTFTGDIRADTNTFVVDVLNNRVGIGTTSPKYMLDVDGTLNAVQVLVNGANISGNASSTGSLTLGDSQDDVLYLYPGTIKYFNSATTTLPNSLINAFSIATSSSNIPIFTVDTKNGNLGRIGIGTTSPAHLFEVGGDTYFGGNSTTTGRMSIFYNPQSAGQSNVFDSALYINSNGAVPDANMLGIADAGIWKFRVDKEGDIFTAGNLTTTGTVQQATTSVTGNLTVEGWTLLGDAPNNDYTEIRGYGLIRATSTNAALSVYQGSTGQIFDAYDENTKVFTILDGGNTGIGTTTPNWLLQAAGVRPFFTLSDTASDTNKKHWFLSSQGGNFYLGTTSDAYATSTVSALTVTSNGFFGIATTSPAVNFAVGGHCVTGDTRLRRRRKKSKFQNPNFKSNPKSKILNEDEEYIYDEVQIKDIEPGDEILTLNEKTGKLEYRGVRSLLDMGIERTFVLLTETGKKIRTTANHPYFAKQHIVISGVFEADQSNRIEELNKHTYISIANDDFSDTIVLDKKLKKELYEFYKSKNKIKFFAPAVWARSLAYLIRKNNIGNARIILDKEYSGYEPLITEIIKQYTNNIDINFDIIGKKSPAHFAAYGANIAAKNKKSTEAPVARIAKGDLHPETSSRNQAPFGRLNISYTREFNLSRGKWAKAMYLSVGAEIMTLDGWDRIIKIQRAAKEQVYDIEVEGTHNFIGNDIVAHNTYITGGLGVGTVENTNGNITATGALTVRSTTATSTFSTGGLTVGTSQFVVQQTSGNVGVGTTSPYAKLSVSGETVSNYFTATSTTATSTFSGGFFIGTSTIPSLIVDRFTGNMGIGTANPGAKFEIKINGSNNADLFRIIDSNGNPSLYVTDSPNKLVYGSSFKFDQANNIYQFGTTNFSNSGSFSILNTWSTTAKVLVVRGISGQTADLLQIQNNAETPLFVVNSSGNVGLGTTTPNWLLQANGTRPFFTLSDSSSAANLKHWFLSSQGGNLYVGTSSDAYSTSTVSRLTINSNGLLGIASSSPSSLLTVAGSSYFGTGAGDILTVHAGTVNYRISATSTIPDNTMYAWSIGTSTTNDPPIFRIDTRAGSKATTSISGGFSVDSGAFEYDSTSGITSVDNLELGNLSFDTDGGILSWTDMPVATTTANIIQSYTAQLDGENMLTVYGATDGSGGVKNLGIGIGTTTPDTLLTVNASSTNYNASTTILTLDSMLGDGSPNAASGIGSGLMFRMTNSASSTVAAASIVGTLKTVTSGSEDGELTFFTRASGGALTERLRIDSTGRLGVGTTTPNWLLQANGTRPFFTLSDSSAGTNLRHWFMSSQGGNLYVGTSSDAYATSTVSRLTITSNGNFGIASSTPYAPLSVSGLLAASNFNADDSTATSTFKGGFYVGTTSSPYLMVDRNTGNIGIGIANPTASIVHINSQLPSDNPRIHLTNSSTGTTGSDGVLFGINNSNEFVILNYENSPTEFFVGGNEKMRIHSNGGVGIGTTTPNWLLQANGTRPFFTLSDSSAGANLKHWFLSSQGGNLYVGTSSDAYATSSVSALTVTSNGFFGIATTSPAVNFAVGGHCVTGDTRLRRRRRRRKSQFSNPNFQTNSNDQNIENCEIENSMKIENSKLKIDDDYIYDEVMIKDIQPGDEILTLNEKTGKLEYRGVRSLLDMGVKEIYKLTTASGKTIRTTGNHPYLAEVKPDGPKQKLFRFEIDQSIRIEELNKDTIIAVANNENSFAALIPRKLKRSLNEIFRKQGETKKFAPAVFASAITAVLIKSNFKFNEIIIDTEYPGHEKEISNIINFYFPELEIHFNVIGKKSLAHFTAYGVYINKKNLDVKLNQNDLFKIVNTKRNSLRTVTQLDESQSIRSSHRLSLTSSIVKNDILSSAREWTKVIYLKKGQRITVKNEDEKAVWDTITKIDHLPAEQVYDIEVEGTHNFIGNDIVAHNTYITGGLGVGTVERTNGNITATGALTVQSTTATSTFSTGGLNIGSGQFVVQQTSGNVGIGTTTPQRKLEIYSGASGGNSYSTADLVIEDSNRATLQFLSPSTQSAAIYFGDENSSTIGQIYYDHTTDRMGFGSAGNKFNILDNGNIGLGTTTPYWNMQIASSTKTFLTLSDMSAGTDLKHWFMSSQGGNFYLGTSSDAYATSSVSALTINSDSRIGIGTTTPFEKFAVQGGIGADYLTATSNTATSTFKGVYANGSVVIGGTNVSSPNGWTWDSGSRMLRVGSTNSYSSDYGISIRRNVDGLVGADLWQDEGGNTFYFDNVWNDSSGKTVFRNRTASSPVTVMSLNSTGNVGIGTTTPNWLLQANGTRPFFALSDSLAAANLKHWFLSSQGGNLYVGTSSDVYATTTYLTLVNGGNMGLGSTSPNSLLALDKIGENFITIGNGTKYSRIGYGGTGSQDLEITNLSSGHSLSLKTNNTKRITISGSGEVGIGTSTSNWLLQANGTRPFFTLSDSSAGTNLRHWFLSSQGGNLYIGTSSDAYATTSISAFMISKNGNVGIGTTTPNARLSIEGPCGDADTSGGCVDIAELYNTSEPVEQGEIVGVFSEVEPLPQAQHEVRSLVKKASQGDAVIGIVSSNPAMTIEGSALEFLAGTKYEHNSMKPAVALAGRVPVKVSLEGGEIKPGDRIALSSVPGVGMKATSSGITVGIALQEFLISNSEFLNNDQIPDSQKIGKILVFVNLSYSKLDIVANDLEKSLIVDSQSGKIKSSYALDMDDKDIVNVRNILAKSGKWSLDENGKLTVEKIETEKIEVKNPYGITIYDTETGEPMCVVSENRTLRSIPGKCEDIENNQDTKDNNQTNSNDQIKNNQTENPVNSHGVFNDLTTEGNLHSSLNYQYNQMNENVNSNAVQENKNTMEVRGIEPPRSSMTSEDSLLGTPTADSLYQNQNSVQTENSEQENSNPLAETIETAETKEETVQAEQPQNSLSQTENLETSTADN